MKKEKGVMPDNKPDDKEVEYLDDETNYSSKSELSKAAKVSEQVSRCLTLRSVDLRAGYTTWVADKSGSLKPQIIPDTRKAYCNSIIALKLLLSPEIESIPRFKKKVDEYNNMTKKLFLKFGYRERISREIKPGSDIPIWIYGDNFYMPEIGSLILKEDGYNKLTSHEQTGVWDSKVNQYWDNLVFLYDELFAILNELIHEKDYFKETSGW